MGFPNQCLSFSQSINVIFKYVTMSHQLYKHSSNLTISHKNRLLSTVSYSDGEVPGSAVLVFDVELIDLEEGLPDGYMFVWNNDVSPDLFTEMDKNKDAQVDSTEV